MPASARIHSEASTGLGRIQNDRILTRLADRKHSALTFSGHSDRRLASLVRDRDRPATLSRGEQDGRSLGVRIVDFKCGGPAVGVHADDLSATAIEHRQISAHPVSTQANDVSLFGVPDIDATSMPGGGGQHHHPIVLVEYLEPAGLNDVQDRRAAPCGHHAEDHHHRSQSEGGPFESLPSASFPVEPGFERLKAANKILLADGRVHGQRDRSDCGVSPRAGGDVRGR